MKILLRFKNKYFGDQHYLHVIVMSGERLYSKDRGSIVLDLFGSHPKARILDFFLDNPFLDFSMQEVIRELRMGKRTFYRYFRELLARQVIVPTRKIGRAQLYTINLKHPAVKAIYKLLTEIALKDAEMYKVPVRT